MSETQFFVVLLRLHAEHIIEAEDGPRAVAAAAALHTTPGLVVDDAWVTRSRDEMRELAEAAHAAPLGGDES